MAGPPLLFSQTDEIQVYDAEIAETGVFNLMVHSNFTPIGRKGTDFAAPSSPTTRSMAPANGLTVSPRGSSRGFTCRYTASIRTAAAQPSTDSKYANYSFGQTLPNTSSSTA
jgi:hypothetical protein